MQNQLTLGDLKNSELPSHLNFCPTDPRFTQKINRTLEWLLCCGSFDGTTRLMDLCVHERCVVLPGCVNTLLSVFPCHGARRIENNWYRMLPGYNPHRWEHGELWFEYRDNVPCFRPLCAPRVLRCFVAESTDRGKKIKFLGYDKNAMWVRTRQSGVMEDGEVVTFGNPFADTVTEWSSVTAVVKDETDSVVHVFSHAINDSTLLPFGTYQYWETKPSYQRYEVNAKHELEDACCHGNDGCGSHGHQNVVQAEIKLAFIPAKHDNDILPIGNRVAMEMAVMGVKALDDGDVARADALLFGDGRNMRIGAIPLLNQEIRTNTGDRFAANVRVGGPCGFRTIVRGFI